MNFLLFLVFSLINYLVGSVPWALVIGKVFYKTDVREFGSGNLGATNTGRVLGRKASVIVAVLDALKGAIVFWILSLINYNIAVYASVFCAIGHCYPLFAQFKGGKAVATTFGIILAITTSTLKELILVFIIPLAIWFTIKKLTDLVSLASLFAILISAVLSTFVCDISKTFALTLLFALVAFRHKDNIVRLLQGTETKSHY